MNDFEAFDSLVSRARKEQPPPVHVTPRVLHDLQSISLQKQEQKTLLFLSGVALAAACLIAAFSFQFWAVLSDPLAGFFSPMNMVML